MTHPDTFDVVCIGNYTKDTIISPLGTMYVDGGAVNYAAHAAVALGMKTAVVTHLAEEDDRVVKKLEQVGVRCYPTYTPFSTLMKLEYPTTNPDIRTLSVAHTAGTITASEVNFIQARAAIIGSSLRGEVGDDVIPVLKRNGLLVAADMQGYVRVLRDQALVYESWPEMPQVLAQLDVLKSDAVEAEALTGEKDIYKAAKVFSSMGPREIVLTHKDGLLIYANNECFETRFFARKLDGRSGRGDTCLGAYVSARLSKSPEEAGIWAAALTSLKMETLGPFHRPIRDVEELIASKYKA